MPKKRSKEEAISGLKHNVPFKSYLIQTLQALFYEQSQKLEGCELPIPPSKYNQD